MRRMTLLTLVSAAVAALSFGPAAVQAQGYPGGGGGMGGMGGMGGRRGGMGGNRGGMRRPISQDDLEKRYENMASLKPVLKHIKLDDTEKDTLDKVEKAYRPQLGDYGRAAYNLFQDGGRPDADSLAAIRSGARKLRDQEFDEARALLTADQQKTFDENVTKVHDDEAKRDEDMRSRMPGYPS